LVDLLIDDRVAEDDDVLARFVAVDPGDDVDRSGTGGWPDRRCRKAAACRS